MEVTFLELGQVADHQIAFAVISARMNGKWLFVQHKDRDTWEIPGGHREQGESIDATAKRELYEETGALDFDIRPICEYGVTREGKTSYGRLYIAEVKELGELPAMEISKVDSFDTIPNRLTYEAIQPYLHRRVLQTLTSH